MRHLVLISSVAFLFVGQNGRAAVTGSWSSEFKGQTFARLELHSEAGKLSGTLALADIQVDEHGGVRSVGEQNDALSIFDVSQQESKVSFSRKNDDDAERFEFRLLDSTHGELRFLATDELRAEVAASGIPLPKPFLLTRQTPSK